ncbi:MAG: putative baseplate assembly protein, partial [Kovacikia sp.]
TRYPNAPSNGTVLTADQLRTVPLGQYKIFEPFTSDSIDLYRAHNQIHFYTWGDRQCCLPKGATTATLLDEWQPPAKITSPKSSPKQEDAYGSDNPAPPPPPERKLKLKIGDILIFEEVKGATTGNEADAELTHRHAVRLVNVVPLEDTLYPQKVRGFNETLPTPVVEITWAMEDALPFPLCISAIGPAPDCRLITDITVAHGNVILVDHGQTLVPEQLELVESKEELQGCEREGQPADITTSPKPYRPVLKYAPLTFRQPLSAQELSQTPASKLLTQDPRQALPQITALIGVPPNYTEGIDPNTPPDRPEWRWTAQPDLLSSQNRDRHFVVEMDNDSNAHLRFGDGELGQQPQADTRFFATYRIGNGPAGNIGADRISHIVFRQPFNPGSSLQPHNPLSTRGGMAPEPLSEVKLFAPHTFRKELQRAITAQDYSDLVMRDFGDRVQQAGATLRWTGSWYEVLVAIDPLGTETPSEALLEEIGDRLYRYRRMGHDVVVKAAVYVSLDIAMTVCVQPDYLRGHVKAALLDVFSNRKLPAGQLGFFDPDNLTFGTGIALSKLVAYARAVTGVDNVTITTLKRLGEVDQGALLTGILPMEPLEIPRLDNDPNFPENGKLTLNMRGGR